MILLPFVFTSSAQAHTISQQKRTFAVETNRIWLNVTGNNGAFSQTLFGYRTGATTGYDAGLDGAFWNDGAIALASLIGDVRYAIQFKGLPFSNTDVVPLSFSPQNGGTYTFAIDHVDGLFLNNTQPIYIHDKQTGTYTNLKNSSYSFYCGAGRIDTRFELTYVTPANSSLGQAENQFTASNLEIYNDHNTVVVKSGKTILKQLILHTINGQLIYENNNVHAVETAILKADWKQQVLILTATTEDGVTVSKKWVSL